MKRTVAIVVGDGAAACLIVTQETLHQRRAQELYSGSWERVARATRLAAPHLRPPRQSLRGGGAKG